jgi:uncharacterized protein YbaA (DUF1428 family)
MSHYVDGFVIPIAKDKVEAYRIVAEKASAIWKEYGALEYRECVGDDFTAENMVSFPQLAGATEDQTVILAYIRYESREQRDQIMAKVMADPRMNEMCDPENPSFDYTRMAYGGFRTIVEA